MLLRAFLTVFALAIGTSAHAQCMAPHRFTGQIVPAQEMPGPTGFFDAIASYAPNGYPVITYGQAFLVHPPLLQNFIRLHECAHLALPTQNEFVANCYALVMLRRQGLPLQIEQLIAQYHIAKGPIPPQYGGSGLVFWQQTLACANGPNPF